MSCDTPIDFCVRAGATFSHILRWETLPVVYKAITGIAQTAPVRITCPAHEVTDGWRVAIVSVKGMTQINAQSPTPRTGDYRPANVLDSNTIELNAVNAANFSAYTSGGYVQYNTPVDLSLCTARMKIKDAIDGTLLASTESADAPLNTITISLDNVYKTITITIPAATTAGFSWLTGVYDIEIQAPSGVVTALLAGTISVTPEITTS